MTSHETIDPRIEAEAALYDMVAHAAHKRAIRKCEDEHRAYTHVFSEWNKDFTGWSVTGHVAITHYGSGWFGLIPCVPYPAA